MFTKLFSSITESTIWREPDHVRLVWITMLAKSDSSGFVWSSIPGMADAARVSLPQCLEAIERLKSPDEWSRTKDNEGKRIEDVDGGWRLLNYEKYRKIRNMEERREYVRKKVAEHRLIVNNVNKSKQCKQMLTHAEVEVEVEVEVDSNTYKKRLNLLFKRRDTTPWNVKEQKSLIDLMKRPEFESEISDIEKRYTSGVKYLRQDIQTLLNNWNGELDKARNLQTQDNKKTSYSFENFKA